MEIIRILVFSFFGLTGLLILGILWRIFKKLK